MSADDVAGELRSGMTIGIGGWGSRRKPMALVRAILRSGLTGPEIVSYGGPDVGLLIAGGHVRRVVCGFVSLDTIAAGAAFPAGPPAGDGRAHRAGRGDAALGPARGRAPAAVPADPGGPGLRRAAGEPGAAHGPLPLRRRRGTGRHARAAARRRADPPEPRATPPATGSTWGPTRTSTTCSAWRPGAPIVSCERIVPTASLLESGPPQSLLVNRAMVRRRGRGARRRALHQLRARLRPRRGVPGPVRGGGRRPGGLAAVPGRVPGRRRGRLPAGRTAVRRPSQADGVSQPAAPMTARPPDRSPGPGTAPAGWGRWPARPAVERPSLAEVCVVACAEAWRGDGAILASPMGLIPTLGARLAQLTFAPDLLLTDGEAICSPACRTPGRPDGARARHRGLAALPLGVHDGGGGPPARDDGGRRRSTGSATRTSPASATGPGPRPSCSGCAARPATPSTTRSATGCPGTRAGSSSSGWTWSAASATTARPASARGPPASTSCAWSSPTWPCWTSRPRTTPCGSRSVHPGVTVGDVTAATGFPLAVPGEVPVTRLPHRAGAGPDPRHARPGGRCAEPGDRRDPAPALTEPARHRLPDRPGRRWATCPGPGWRRRPPRRAGSASSRRRR